MKGHTEAMTELKRIPFFRYWRTPNSKSTGKIQTEHTRSTPTASQLYQSANGAVCSDVNIAGASCTALEVSPKQQDNDLWSLAYKELLAEDETLIRDYEEVLKKAIVVPGDTAVDLQGQIQAVLASKRKQIIQKQWRLQWGNKSIKIRTQIDHIVKIIGAFKDAGSVAANVDPLHAGLPWAGICFLLTVSATA